MATTSWQEGENLFRFGASPFLPAASFYLGVVVIIAVFNTWISALRDKHRFTKRQLWAFSVSAITFIIGLVVSSRTPIALQTWIDSIPTSN